MLTRDLLSQILNQLPVGGILGPKLPLQASFAHRQFAGDLNKRRNVSNDAPGKDRQNPMTARPMLPEVIEKLPGLGVKDLQQHRVGREQVQLQVSRTEVYTILGLVKLHGQAKDPLMFRRTGRSRVAECDRKGLHVSRRQPPQRDQRTAGHGFHRLPGRTHQVVVQMCQCFIAAHRPIPFHIHPNPHTVIQESRVLGKPPEGFLRSPATQQNIAEDVQGAGIEVLGTVQTEVSITGQPNGLFPEMLGDRPGDTRVGLRWLGMCVEKFGQFGGFKLESVEVAEQINQQFSGNRALAGTKRSSDCRTRHCLDSTRRRPATQLRKMGPLNGGVRE